MWQVFPPYNIELRIWTQETGSATFDCPFVYLIYCNHHTPLYLCIFLCSPVCSVRVIGESDIMQEFLSESDEVWSRFDIALMWTVLEKPQTIPLRFDAVVTQALSITTVLHSVWSHFSSPSTLYHVWIWFSAFQDYLKWLKSYDKVMNKSV